MLGCQWDRRTTLIALLPLAAACGSGLRSQGPIVTPTPTAAARPGGVDAVPAPPPQAAPSEDPVLTLIATSDLHFKAGQKELEQGHVEAAKLEFNHAVDVLLESTYGARTEPRTREYRPCRCG